MVIHSKDVHSKRKYLNVLQNCKLIEENENHTIHEFKVTEDTLNSVRTLHGGCTSTILEYCMNNATHRKAVTVDLSISFLSAAKLNDILLIETFKVKEGGTLAFINAEIYRKSDNIAIAIGKQTVAFSQNFHSKL